ncbi:hypothetical protein RY975_001188 [Citrobacter braakii]|nr:hypothetical protein [Citrobacter braakii]
MDKSKAVLEVSVKAVEFIQAELRAAGLTGDEFSDIAECLMAAANSSRRELLEQAKNPASFSDRRELSDAARNVYSSLSNIPGNK